MSGGTGTSRGDQFGISQQQWQSIGASIYQGVAEGDWSSLGNQIAGPITQAVTQSFSSMGPLGGIAGGFIGAAIGGLFGGLFGKKKKRGDTSSEPLFVHVVNNDEATGLLPHIQAMLRRAAGAGLNQITGQLSMQGSRVGV